MKECLQQKTYQRALTKFNSPLEPSYVLKSLRSGQFPHFGLPFPLPCSLPLFFYCLFFGLRSCSPSCSRSGPFYLRLLLPSLLGFVNSYSHFWTCVFRFPAQVPVFVLLLVRSRFRDGDISLFYNWRSLMWWVDLLLVKWPGISELTNASSWTPRCDRYGWCFTTWTIWEMSSGSFSRTATVRIRILRPQGSFQTHPPPPPPFPLLLPLCLPPCIRPFLPPSPLPSLRLSLPLSLPPLPPPLPPPPPPPALSPSLNSPSIYPSIHPFTRPSINHVSIYSDLRQDMLTLQLIKIMDKIWQNEGLDLGWATYLFEAKYQHSRLYSVHVSKDVHKHPSTVSIPLLEPIKPMFEK